MHDVYFNQKVLLIMVLEGVSRIMVFILWKMLIEVIRVLV